MILWLHCLLVKVELALERSLLLGVCCLLNHVLDIVYALLFPFLFSLLGTLVLKLVLFLVSVPLDFLPPHLTFHLKESRLLQSSLLLHLLPFESSLLLQLLPFELFLLPPHLFFLLSLPHFDKPVVL